MSSDEKVSTESSEEDNKLDPDREDENSVDSQDTGIEIDAEAVELETEEDSIDEEELTQLRQDLIDAQEMADKNQEAVLRVRAEIENLRRRTELDIEKAHKYSIEKFAQALIPVIDSLEMGFTAANEQGADIEKLKEGAELTMKMFGDATSKFGLESVDPIGDEFNPEFHQAMSMQETADEKANTVLAVMQKGYLLHGRLIRPAMVVVSKAAASGSGSRADKVDNPSEDKKGTKIDEKA